MPKTKKPIARSKRQAFSPADYGLTGAEFCVYQIVEKRHAGNKTTTSGDVAREWGGKNRSYTYKVLASLIVKGVVEQYSQRYYRLAKQGV